MTPEQAATAATSTIRSAIPQHPTIEARFGMFSGARPSPTGVIPVSNVPAWVIAIHGLGPNGSQSSGLQEVTSFVAIRDEDGTLAGGALVTETGTEHLP
jgi:hypothetical protein